MIDQLPPIPVALPLCVAGILLALSRVLPSRVPDIIAILTALGSAILCGVMAAHAADQPLTYWFGGWTPRGDQVIGIDFLVDQAGGALAAFIGLIFTASMVFAWGYYDEVHAHFHVLMLLFMAGMTGFCLTHDIFNMFVWFEVMSVAAFALTGYALRSPALAGALNFTVVNTIGSYLILGGIGLIYTLGGALDFGALGKSVAAHPADPVVFGAFTLLSMGFLIKAAQVPFQPWLADAHAVAPSPVSVIFSGAMVALGLFGIARIVFTIFGASPQVMHVVGTLMLGMGVVSAVMGGVMAMIQRHIKRLLAFSTISHTGILLTGLALLDRGSVAGFLSYLVGHGLVKASLFMVAGIIEALCGGVDEIGLRGAGRGIWPAGIAMMVGALLLGGLPFGLLDSGLAGIAGSAHAWVTVLILFGAGCTGAAVLRVTGRVFLGLGPVPGEEERGPTDEEKEKADRPLWLMLTPAAVLLLLSLAPEHLTSGFAGSAAGMLMDPNAVHAKAPPHPPLGAWAWITMGAAILLAAYKLERRRLPSAIRQGLERIGDGPANWLQTIHSGLVGDYVAWVVVGLAAFAVAFILT